mmetsp:Transcript_45089/g.143594  ORF Transcript_45089/g.143594 Transcript_45089/m.143594 type:complete len:325 (-) Transcript_45089:1005-1979(-)
MLSAPSPAQRLSSSTEERRAPLRGAALTRTSASTTSLGAPPASAAASGVLPARSRARRPAGWARARALTSSTGAPARTAACRASSPEGSASTRAPSTSGPAPASSARSRGRRPRPSASDTPAGCRCSRTSTAGAPAPHSAATCRGRRPRESRSCAAPWPARDRDQRRRCNSSFSTRRRRRDPIAPRGNPANSRRAACAARLGQACSRTPIAPKPNLPRARARSAGRGGRLLLGPPPRPKSARDAAPGWARRRSAKASGGTPEATPKCAGSHLSPFASSGGTAFLGRTGASSIRRSATSPAAWRGRIARGKRPAPSTDLSASGCE